MSKVATNKNQLQEKNSADIKEIVLNFLSSQKHRDIVIKAAQDSAKDQKKLLIRYKQILAKR